MLQPIQWLMDFLICLVKYASGLLVAGLIGLVNLLIAGIGALVGFLIGLLPEVQLGSISLPDQLAWGNWLFPINHAVAALLLVVTVLVAWTVINIGLRWAKAAQ